VLEWLLGCSRPRDGKVDLTECFRPTNVLLLRHDSSAATCYEGRILQPLVGSHGLAHLLQERNERSIHSSHG
jgi:hypothetical protein